MGAFADLFGIDPIRWYDLTVRDTLQLEAYLEEHNRRIEEASDGGG